MFLTSVLAFAAHRILQLHLFDLKPFEYLPDLRRIVDGHQEAPLDSCQRCRQIQKVLLHKVIAIAWDLPVWRVEEEEGVLAIILGDQLPEVKSLVMFPKDAAHRQTQ